MDNKKQFTLRSRANSFGYAYRGVIQLIRQEANAQIHLVITLVVIIAGFIKGLRANQWIAITIAIGIVWIAEGLNTAIEVLCNHINGPEYHPNIKIIKDLSAGAVLMASITSAIVGIIVFLSH